MSQSEVAKSHGKGKKQGMFAKSSSDEKYHLLSPDEEKTLCGHPVAPLIIDRPVEVSALHLTKIHPPGYVLCEVCANAVSKQQTS